TAPVTLSFGTDWSSGVRGDIMKQALALFAQQHPTVTLDRHDIGDDYFTRVAGDFAAGTQDDVTLFDGPQFDHFRKLGKFVDLTPLLKARRVDPAATHTRADPVYTPDGKRYAMPFQLTVGAWFVNKTLFRQEGLAPPTDAWTWNEWADAARRLTKADKNQWGLGPALNTNLQVSVLPLLISNGAHHVSEDGRQTTLTAPAALETIRWVADRVTRDQSWAAPGVAGVGFPSGNVAMAWGNTGSIGNSANGWVQSISDKFEWDVMPQPKAPKTGRSVTTFNEQPYVITTKDRGAAGRVEAGLSVLLHLAGKDVQSLIAAQRGSTPVLRELARTSPYLDAPPASMGVINRSLDTLAEIRFFAGYLEWRDAYAGALQEIWTGKIAPDAGAQKAVDAGNAALARQGAK
ncbi:MAG TPA: extracellular solute-binding protein, partial [Chloroflexota bacterium]|nr:extracellular solute-binding protein [Chloroflexota bacterium]